jgi:hypothetical protein
MTEEEMISKAQIISTRLNDPDGFWFYYKAVKLLGFQICSELVSLTMEMHRLGKLKRSQARYFNGCVLRESKERGIVWRIYDNSK